MATIRPEIPEDTASIRHVNQDAFNQNQEADIVDNLRKRGVLAISLVVIQDGEVVGHITFSPIEITSDEQNFEAVALAPMAVLPSHQNKGISSQLVFAGLQECHQLGHKIIVVLGHPNYYPRFSFVPAKNKGIECGFEVPTEAWMITELKQGALAGRRGKVRFQNEFKEAA